MEILEKLKTVLLYDPAILLLGIFLKKIESLSQRDICTLIFIATLFAIDKIWEQPKYSLTSEWVKKM